MQTLNLYIVFFTAFALSLGITPLLGRLAKQLHIVDKPAHRKTHAETIPYFGGAAIFISLLISFTLTVILRPDFPQYLQGSGFMKALFILGPTFGMVILGLLDDMRNLRARYKLLGQVLFATLFAVFGFHFSVFHLPGLKPEPLSFLSIPVTIFWIVAVVNAFNMIDGLDGLAATVAVGALGLLSIETSMVENTTGLMLSLGAVGAVLGFLIYNWKPAKIYLGDMGSGGLGMFLACSLIALGQTYGQPIKALPNNGFGQPFDYQLLIATLLVSYPALEITLSVIRRILHGRSIVRADQGHIHHRLLKMGFDKPVICVIALLMNLLPSLAAIATIAKYHGWATWILALFGVIVGLGLSALGFLDFLKPKTVGRLRPHFQIAHHFISMQKVKLSLAATREDVLTLVNQTCQELGVKSYRLIIPANENKKGGLDYTHEWDPTRDSIATHRDKVSLNNNRGGAEWVFIPPSGDEEELDMEYRVVISEFMREALQTAVQLGKNQATLELPSVASLPSKFVSGHSLRKRRKSNREPAHS